jgi:exonuclease SbcC
MLKWINLQNFKRHESLRLDLTPGLNALVGPNGSGKSSVLAAIAYALGLPISSANSYLWNLNSDSKDRLVELCFYYLGDVYVVSRKPKYAELSKNGKIAVTGTNAVNAELDKIFGMPSAVRGVLCYSMQGDTTKILDMGGTAFQLLVERLFNLDVLDKLVTTIRADITKLTKLTNGVNLESMKQGLDALNRELEEYRLKLQQHRSELIQVQANKLVLEDELQKANAAMESAQRCREEYTKAESMLAEANYKIAQSQALLLSKEEEKAAFLADKHENFLTSEYLEKLKNEIHELKQEQIKLENTLLQEMKATTELQVLQNQLDTLEAEMISPPDDDYITKLVQCINMLHQEIANEEHSIEHIRQILKDSICPTCSRPYDMEADSKEELAKKLSDYQGNLEENNKHLTLLVGERSQLVAEKLKYEAQVKKLADLRASLKTQLLPRMTDTEIRALKEELEALSEKYNQKLHVEFNGATRNRLQFLKLDSESKELTTQLTEATQVKTTATEKLSKLPVVLAEDVSSAWNSVVETSAKLKAISTQFETITFAISSIVDSLHKDETRYTKSKDELDHWSEQYDKVTKLVRLKDILINNRLELGSSLWITILQQASKLAALMSHGAITSIARNGDNSIVVVDNGLTLPVDEVSGARQDIIGLSLRVALNQVCAGNNALMLIDEASAHAQDSVAASMVNTLRDLGLQIVFSTHRAGDSVSAETLISLTH